MAGLTPLEPPSRAPSKPVLEPVAAPSARVLPPSAASVPSAARLVVIGDSFTFHGPDGPVPLADPRLYPNVLAARLVEATGRQWRVHVVARAGWSLRDVWLALQKDVHLQQELLVGAHAVVLGVGSFDWVPVAVPTPLRALLPYVRPTGLRRRLRVWLDDWHGRLVRATRGALLRTPPSVFAHCWRKSVIGIRVFAPHAALSALLPGIHRAPYYGLLHPHHERAIEVTTRLGAELDVPLVDLPAITARHFDALNPDGIHWAWAQHTEVAEALADALLPRLAEAAAVPAAQAEPGGAAFQAERGSSTSRSSPSSSAS